ncbi:MAG: YihY/virulence factor BrkB family protein [Bryobacteraceae bacterium]|jgi:membrane protein
MPSKLRTFFRLLRGALVKAYQDGCLGTAKGAAYSALLAFFPLLATIATVLVHVRADFVSRQISGFLDEILPPGTHRLVFQYFAVRGTQPFFIPLTGMLVSIWAASGVMVSLMEGFQAAYRIPAGRSFLRQRVVALLLVLSAAIPTLAASILILFGERGQHWLLQALGLLPAGAELRGGVLVLGAMLRYAIALGAIVLGAAILYRYGPNRPQRWKCVWPGAVLATVLWLGATSLFAWYARHIANYNVVYGSAARVILLLVWMYVLAVVALTGCEFNAECEMAAER